METAGHRPEDYYSLHKSDYQKIGELNSRQAELDKELREEREVFEKARSEGAHHQDLLDLKPNEYGYRRATQNVQAEQVAAKAEADAHLEEAASHYQQNQDAYYEEAQELDK